jgi:hypothetical protein
VLILFCVPTGEVGRFIGALKRQNLASACLDLVPSTFERPAVHRAAALGTRALQDSAFIEKWRLPERRQASPD